ncbi:MAG: phosphatase PAP2 family protein [Pseudomonadota bacterium]|nr:phosphatase PAP2 family protein [Pseudomonadota bacterium]
MGEPPHARQQLEPLGRRIVVASAWGALVGVVFFAVYPTTNHWASQRASTTGVYVDWELAIPFMSQWVWVYLSMYLLFVVPPFWLGARALRRLAEVLIVVTLLAGLVFVAWPGHLGHVRELPADPLLRRVFAAIFALDAAHNTWPSLHVAYSTAIVLALWPRLAPAWRVMLGLWLCLLCLSTLLVHQHHVFDVVAGGLLAWGVHRIFAGRRGASAARTA